MDKIIPYYAFRIKQSPANPLQVWNCGYYYILETVKMSRTRDDYYLIYLINGSLTFSLNGIKHSISKNQFLFYRPFELQEYTIYKKSNTQYYWIHFTGTEADRLVEQFNIPSGALQLINASEIATLIISIIQEYKLKLPYFEEMGSSTLYKLLTSIGRSLLQTNNYFEQVIEAIHSNPLISNESLANICHFSTSYFIKKFTQIYKMSPQKYKHMVLLKQAKDLLVYTSLSVTKIALTLNFDNDPLYFNKFFKSHTGMTPIEYRKKHITTKNKALH